MLSRSLCIDKNDIPAVWLLTQHTVTMLMTSKQTNLAYNFEADQVWDLFLGILATSSCLLAGWHSAELTNRDSFQASSKIEQNQAYVSIFFLSHAMYPSAHMPTEQQLILFTWPCRGSSHPLIDCLENENAIHHVFRGCTKLRQGAIYCF
jgi:hypothetical protein